MANTTHRAAPPPEYKSAEQGRAGGSFLKPGMLKSSVVVQIDARPVREDGPNGPVPSNFEGNVDIPITVSTVPYIVTVSTKSKDYADMVAMFGGDFEAWPGQSLRISNDRNLNKVRVEPIAGTGVPA